MKISKKDIIFTFIIIALASCLLFSVRRCMRNDDYYETNIKALTDTLHYYKSKKGDTIVYKQGFQINSIDEMKKLYPELYIDMRDMILKNSVKDAVHFEGTIENEVHDTTYVVKHDTITRGFEHTFDFNNEFRTLSGRIQYAADTLNFKIEHDIVNFNYTVAQDKSGKIYIKSSNPYVKYNEITGFQIKPVKTKKWHIGPQVSVGYNDKIRPYVGIGVTYSVFSF